VTKRRECDALEPVRPLIVGRQRSSSAGGFEGACMIVKLDQ
jgi:hypothetical protein